MKTAPKDKHFGQDWMYFPAAGTLTSTQGGPYIPVRGLSNDRAAARALGALPQEWLFGTWAADGSGW
ncbi:MAG TPA: hypothetical protein VME46_20495 [Acidimicrobiales bacterium]|nr:hypothetical protein [Acidimicrobiales bacterium]